MVTWYVGPGQINIEARKKQQQLTKQLLIYSRQPRFPTTITRKESRKEQLKSQRDI